MSELKQHPLSRSFPAMQDSEFEALKDSIAVIGVQNPITLFDGMVIDGWHRYKAAKELALEVNTQELESWIEPVDFVLAQNTVRRHITEAEALHVDLSDELTKLSISYDAVVQARDRLMLENAELKMQCKFYKSKLDKLEK